MARANRMACITLTRVHVYANRPTVRNFVATLGKGIAVKCVTVSMISRGRQAEGNDDKTYQLIGDAYTHATTSFRALYFASLDNTYARALRHRHRRKNELMQNSNKSFFFFFSRTTHFQFPTSLITNDEILKEPRNSILRFPFFICIYNPSKLISTFKIFHA